MNVELIDSVEEFIATTSVYRAADPLRTNVIGSVSLAVSTGHSTYDGCHWWVVRDGDDVVGIAMRTGPLNMVLAPMTPNAARALGESVARFDDALPGVTGSSDVLDAFFEGYVASKSPGSRRAMKEQRRDLLYELEELVTPDVEGFGRPVSADEVEPISAMFMACLIELELEPLSPAEARESVAKSVVAGTLFCWEMEGAVVAIAGHAPIVTTGSTSMGRVGPVYTPTEFRRRGFGSAVTAHVTRHLLERGARVMLFTDAANPTSNGIYQAIGYRLVDDLIQVVFE